MQYLTHFLTLPFFYRTFPSYQNWRWVCNFIRACTEKHTVYVLKLQNKKYYVGSTTHKRRRMREHNSDRGGSKWTKMNKPIRMLQVRE